MYLGARTYPPAATAEERGNDRSPKGQDLKGLGSRERGRRPEYSSAPAKKQKVETKNFLAILTLPGGLETACPAHLS